MDNRRSISLNICSSIGKQIGKWVLIERNQSSYITSRLVDGSVWEQWVSQWNNTPESFGLLLYLLLMSPATTVFSANFSVSCQIPGERRKLNREITCTSCLNLYHLYLFDTNTCLYFLSFDYSRFLIVPGWKLRHLLRYFCYFIR